jgi:hypothetical protein
MIKFQVTVVGIRIRAWVGLRIKHGLSDPATFIYDRIREQPNTFNHVIGHASNYNIISYLM